MLHRPGVLREIDMKQFCVHTVEKSSLMKIVKKYGIPATSIIIIVVAIMLRLYLYGDLGLPSEWGIQHPIFNLRIPLSFHGLRLLADGSSL